MITVQTLQEYTIEQETRFGLNGYTTSQRYHVMKQESPERTSITLALQALERPYQQEWPHDPETFQLYQRAIAHGLK